MLTGLKSRVMLVDDHAMLRHGMAMLVNPCGKSPGYAGVTVEV
jgi:hypothetical protein